MHLLATSFLASMAAPFFMRRLSTAVWLVWVLKIAKCSGVDPCGKGN